MIRPVVVALIAVLLLGGAAGCTVSRTDAGPGGAVSSEAGSSGAGSSGAGSSGAASSGAGSSGAVPPGAVPLTRVVTLTTADGVRSAIVHHPASARPDAPLVVVLHPAATSASTMEANFGWDALADRHGFVTVYPDGLLDSFQDTWNGGRCCPPASQLRTDDVGFLTSLVTALRRVDGVSGQAYAVGFSNGAILAYAWACARPGLLAGIGVVAGALMTDCSAAPALTVVAVHGSADPSIPLAGGPAPDGFRFPALDASLAPFRTAARCPAAAAVHTTATTRVDTWTCAGSVHVTRDVVTGLDHAWPGAGAAAGTSAGPTDATGFLYAGLLG